MQFYRTAIERGVPLDYASYLLPEAALCRIIVTGNFRSWSEMLQKRTCKRALKEFQEIATEIYLELNRICPIVFSEERMKNCKNCTEVSCDFK